MGRAYKNFWSLNTDEAVVVGILRNATSKEIEVLLPLNAQMKGIDLVLLNVKNGKNLTIQVKGSRAYEPAKIEVKKYGLGSPGWFFLNCDTIDLATADYFVFLIYVLEVVDKIGRRIIEPHTITIPSKKLIEMSGKYKNRHGNNKYCYFIWINPKSKRAFDYRDKEMDLSDYLDKKGISKLNNSLVTIVNLVK